MGTKISALTDGTALTLTGAELWPGVQSGTTYKFTVNQIGTKFGLGSYAVGDLLYASSTTALSRLADVAVGSILVSGGVGVAPNWTSTSVPLTGANAGFELGSTATPNTPFIDFHSSGNAIDYDVRLIASSGDASASGGILNCDGTFNVAPRGASLKSAITTAQSASGSQAAGQLYNNVIAISSDNADVGTDPTQSYSIGLAIQHTFGGSATKGGREALFANLNLTATTSSSNTLRFYTAVSGQAQSNVTDGGAIGSSNEKGKLYGSNFLGVLGQTGATGFEIVSAGLDQTIMVSGTSAKTKALRILQFGGDAATDAVQGSTYDAGLIVTGASGGIGGKNGILFGDVLGAHPLASTGTLIATTGSSTVDTGINFSGYTFTTNFLNGPGFTVSGKGKTSITNATSASGVAALLLNTTQTSPNAGDTLDGALSASYTLSAASATNELISRVFYFTATNSLTGGGHIQNLRVLDMSVSTSASTTTDVLTYLLIEDGTTAGTVTTGYGIFISSVQGSTKYGIYDQSGGAWYNAGALGVGTASIGAVGTITATGHVIMATAAKTLQLKQGSNGCVGTFVATGSTAVTVTNTNVAISDAIIFSMNTVGGTPAAAPFLSAITAGTSFQVKAAVGDTSTYNYAIIKNAA